MSPDPKHRIEVGIPVNPPLSDWGKKYRAKAEDAHEGGSDQKHRNPSGKVIYPVEH